MREYGIGFELVDHYDGKYLIFAADSYPWGAFQSILIVVDLTIRALESAHVDLTANKLAVASCPSSRTPLSTAAPVLLAVAVPVGLSILQFRLVSVSLWYFHSCDSGPHEALKDVVSFSTAVPFVVVALACVNGGMQRNLSFREREIVDQQRTAEAFPFVAD